jgi:hypothetical protein
MGGHLSRWTPQCCTLEVKVGPGVLPSLNMLGLGVTAESMRGENGSRRAA